MRRAAFAAALLLAACGNQHLECEDEGLRQRLDHHDECIDANGAIYAAPRYRAVNR